MDESDSKLNKAKESQNLIATIALHENYSKSRVKCNKIPLPAIIAISHYYRQIRHRSRHHISALLSLYLLTIRACFDKQV